ncbi:polysaccharide deacetylase family protein [Paenibacillus sp. DMB20]|uniref:polysaccharide deacetylase family protein n=1 Tax=Paenibacillus sp. DMB20 TaxID=1642570 RepID=UPI000AD71C9C
MRFRLIILSLLVIWMSSGCTQNNAQQSQQAQPKTLPQQQTKIQSNSSTPNLASGKEQNVRSPHLLSLSDLQKKYRSTFLLNGPSTKREVALTFDDAPDDIFTPQVLDVLKQEGVKATFFCGWKPDRSPSRHYETHGSRRTCHRQSFL